MDEKHINEKHIDGEIHFVMAMTLLEYQMNYVASIEYFSLSSCFVIEVPIPISIIHTLFVAGSS